MNHEYFMKIALDLARQALTSGEFPVGCVLVHRNKVLVAGVRKGTAGDNRNEIDHAELVALRRLVELKNQIERSQITAFSTMEPCLMCYSALILAGIGSIVYAYEDVMGGGTGCDRSQLKPLYKNSPVEVVPNILRQESLFMFKEYFADPANAYLQKSLLAEHTLGQ